MAFQKSERLQGLLRYLVSQSNSGQFGNLSEHKIGCAVFNKPIEFNPADDSSVRAQMRLLRLKLHEYFDAEGRDESLILEIPKGGYLAVFRPAAGSVASAEPVHPALGEPVVPGPVGERRPMFTVVVPWCLTLALGILCALLWVRSRGAQTANVVPWPLSEAVSAGSKTQIVVSDANYGALRIFDNATRTLNDYLRPDFWNPESRRPLSVREARLLRYLSKSNLTSYADLSVVGVLLGVIGSAPPGITVRPARDLRLREMQTGNFVLIGSPGSNPWSSLFTEKLNFVESEGLIGDSKKYFANQHPKSGELPKYEGLSTTGQGGVDYATLSLLPTENRKGKVLLIQGLQQESTEAAAVVLSDPRQCRDLMRRLGRSRDTTVYFEVLLRIETVAGEANSSTVVATRTYE